MPQQLFGGGTSLSGAIDYAMTMLQTAPLHSQRRIVDVSGDGSNNSGWAAALARDEAVRAGVVVNGLWITWIEPFLDRHYSDNVIGEQGSFVFAVDSFGNFADAIVNKLVTEIAGNAPNKAASGGLASAELR